ncbi:MULTISPECIES: succinyldiaminopimelate transaminase [unclassified Methylophilus]|uniref:succinyldiaminopimelate transaminase n=1 Tax=unclassified Methylophilus TaxID=2630143 RepID=UPI0006F67B4B|nr:MULTISPECIES: succinyldiaminopimelate transaminase [unclassified Methylophilus]KQT37361.1 succinyldiaminopimelate transaminase [Methylophilus sp. Leaf416]KQT55470.1 succinyldiaminopimelate transaminase [Methylophilus sp. Leaf459]
MNPHLNLLQPYPFQRLRDLFDGLTPNPDFAPVNLSIGEPKHATPEIIIEALRANLGGLASYPTTIGVPALREAINQWLQRRYKIPALNIDKAILPVNGSREALFAFAQAVIDTSVPQQPVVISPNPFYQIYEGAAFLAGATPYFINTTQENDYVMDLTQVPADILKRTQLVYVCSPGNPSGKVIDLEAWKTLFELSDRYGFVIASDECYSEIYFDEMNAPVGALEAAYKLGRDFSRIVMFSSLSKRSNVPGMRSGFVAGDAAIIEKFALYRTYHGCAMNPAVQAASIVAWNDEAHVIENRKLYNEKFQSVTPILQQVWSKTKLPDAAFYLWIDTQQDDAVIAKQLYQDLNITVLPGSFLAREAHGHNPGKGFIRMALVASNEETIEAALRIQTNLS